MTTGHPQTPAEEVKDTPATWLELSGGLDRILLNARLKKFTPFCPDFEIALIS